jgi:hypothetical protein
MRKHQVYEKLGEHNVSPKTKRCYTCPARTNPGNFLRGGKNTISGANNIFKWGQINF